MRDTALTARHQALSAKMRQFAGFNMPLVYSNCQATYILQLEVHAEFLMFRTWENSSLKVGRPLI